ncbi:MAG: DUF58 domain-containing protein [Pseudomonadota bacterium]|nr:DUF58 domain-containing protein [Pseudomonadota bacterium]
MSIAPLSTLRHAVLDKIRARAARIHGLDSLPTKIGRRRIYIVPTRFGIMLALMLVAMLIAGLNYNSNLALAFAFLMVSIALVTMHHCNRNLLGLQVDVATEIVAFAGLEANFEFVLQNDSNVDRRDVEILCRSATATRSVAARSAASVAVNVPVHTRGITRIAQFELRTRYPFGWFHAWTYVQGGLIVHVAPAPAGTRTLPSADGEGSVRRSETRGDEDFSGLRSYEPGVPLKHMAWKVLARGGEAAVRSYTSLAAQPEWLDWSSLGGLDTEARLSQLCLWVLQSEVAQRPYGLRIPGQELRPGRGAVHRLACLRALAAHGIVPS